MISPNHRADLYRKIDYLAGVQDGLRIEDHSVDATAQEELLTDKSVE